MRVYKISYIFEVMFNQLRGEKEVCIKPFCYHFYL